MSVYYSTCGASEVLAHVNLYSTIQHANAIAPSVVFVVEEDEMFKVLHEQHALSDRFIKFLLERNSGWPLACMLPAALFALLPSR